MDSIILANILKKLWNGVAVHWVLFFCSSNSSLMPFDPGPFKGCYSVTPTERTFLMRRNIKTSFSNGCSGIFWDESIEGWSKKQDKTSKQTSQSKRSKRIHESQANINHEVSMTSYVYEVRPKTVYVKSRFNNNCPTYLRERFHRTS